MQNHALRHCFGGKDMEMVKTLGKFSLVMCHLGNGVTRDVAKCLA
jgi:hypothetical protein